ncbi:pilus assembly protein PilV [Anoxybacillus sp. UARK-01]|uniref:Type II secretion system protein n=1 Tax=Anoxybacteroides rupiense TaxID=311460 RepID=A0ABD5ITM4_9BACL|nr:MULTISPECIES: type II secretion system protein [Anoxybacillus]MED5051034.1 type II secretion system protein [Anoxybacillus rupiensis]OQM45703.1 pilus assembly protein PilV [Anoxybacillus sp. UARK-01]
MGKKKFIPPCHSEGFTLIEVLASIVILSAAATGIFLFFTHAMKYTAYNQDKTVAINVARGVLVYMEHLDFSSLKQYVQEEQNSTNEPYATIDGSKCQLSLFEDQQVCRALLQPMINNVQYNEQRIRVFLMPYNDSSQWEALKKAPPPEFPPSLRQKLQEETIENNDSNLQNYLLKIVVIVRWGDSWEQSEWLEGVVANETIR